MDLSLWPMMAEIHLLGFLDRILEMLNQIPLFVFFLPFLGFVDTFREFEKGGGHYSWWSYRTGVRERNIGWRIDYFCASQALRSRLAGACIMPEVTGSDHCPVALELR